MNDAEYKYRRAISFIGRRNYVSAITESKKCIESAARDICEKHSPIEHEKSISFNMAIEEIRDNKLMPLRYYPHLRNIQNFGNTLTHHKDITNRDLTNVDMSTVVLSLDTIMEWYRDHIMSQEDKYHHRNLKSENKKLEGTLSNPQYYSDLKKLEENNYDYGSLLTSNVVLIVTGANIQTELFDRPAAENLRDKIEEKYPLRAIVISDLYYMSDESLLDRQVISIGHPDVNNISAELVGNDSAIDKSRSHFSVKKIEEVTKAVLWGLNPAETKEVVDNFIAADNGLRVFALAVIGE